MTVEMILEDDRWKDAGLENLAPQAVDATLAYLDLDPADWDVSLLGCDDEKIATLNTDFRGKAAATNVLSWPSDERAAATPGGVPALPVASPLDSELGDIAIAYETCEREAEAAGKPISAHITHLLVHGTLHLLGYDHISDPDAVLMERIEVQILASLGLEDPYRGDGSEI